MYMYTLHMCGHVYICIYLHTCLDYVDWCISKHTGSSCDSSNEKRSDVANVLHIVTSLHPLLEACVNEEADGLVGALLNDGGC